jgi:hypothetical protein
LIGFSDKTVPRAKRLTVYIEACHGYITDRLFRLLRIPRRASRPRPDIAVLAIRAVVAFLESLNAIRSGIAANPLAKPSSP